MHAATDEQSTGVKRPQRSALAAKRGDILAETDPGGQTIADGNRPVSIAFTGAVVPNIDSNAIPAMSIEITNAADGAAERLSVDSRNSGIDVDASTPGRLQLYGPAPAADFQRLLETLTYENTKRQPTRGRRKLRVFLQVKPNSA